MTNKDIGAIKGALGEINSRLMAMQKAVAPQQQARPDADAIAQLRKEMAEINAAWTQTLQKLRWDFEALKKRVDALPSQSQDYLRNWRREVALAIAPELAPEDDEEYEE